MVDRGYVVLVEVTALSPALNTAVAKLILKRCPLFFGVPSAKPGELHPVAADTRWGRFAGFQALNLTLDFAFPAHGRTSLSVTARIAE